MIREANPIVVINRQGVIIYTDGRVIFPHKDPPENAHILEEIATIATIMCYVASMKDSTYRSATLTYLNAAIEEKNKTITGG
jgi:hypothetical protein